MCYRASLQEGQLKLRKRIIAGIGAPLILAGLLMTGGAAATPAAAIKNAVLPDTVQFTSMVIVGTSTATVNSTSCTLTDSNQKSFDCRVSGAGSFSSTVMSTGDSVWDSISASANLAITGSFEPITLSVTGDENCLSGAGTAVTKKGPVSVNGKVLIRSISEIGTSPVFTVKGTIKVSTASVGCAA
jgi:hypothetical protein